MITNPVLEVINEIEDLLHQAQVKILAVRAMLQRGGDTDNLKVRFDAPVGTEQERAAAKLWPGDWFDATAYAVLYNSSTNTPAYHTGADLNRPQYADVKAPVYAAADGVVVFAGTVKGWQGQVVVIKHALEDGTVVWTRYAHVMAASLTVGQAVARGAQVGQIADYLPVGPGGDHLHYDIARKDLGATPGDWPGMDKARLLRDYEDPLLFTREHHS